MADLAGRVALVTGGGSGLGRATVELFAEHGAALAVVDRDADTAAAVADKVTAAGGRAVPIPANVSVASEIDAAVAHAVAELGRLDVLCNCAGVLVTGSVDETTEADWDRCFAVNAKGTFLTSRAAAPYLIEAGGVIVNVASVAAVSATRRAAAYSASKGAVVALTRSMAIDLAPHGVRVNVLCPGTVLTPMTEPLARFRGNGDRAAGLDYMTANVPIGRLGTPEEIASVALFLASRNASFLTGAVVNADGGMSA